MKNDNFHEQDVEVNIMIYCHEIIQKIRGLIKQQIKNCQLLIRALQYSQIKIQKNIEKKRLSFQQNKQATKQTIHLISMIRLRKQFEMWNIQKSHPEQIKFLSRPSFIHQKQIIKRGDNLQLLMKCMFQAQNKVIKQQKYAYQQQKRLKQNIIWDYTQQTLDVLNKCQQKRIIQTLILIFINYFKVRFFLYFIFLAPFRCFLQATLHRIPNHVVFDTERSLFQEFFYQYFLAIITLFQPILNSNQLIDFRTVKKTFATLNIILYTFIIAEICFLYQKKKIFFYMIYFMALHSQDLRFQIQLQKVQISWKKRSKQLNQDIYFQFISELCAKLYNNQNSYIKESKNQKMEATQKLASENQVEQTTDLSSQNNQKGRKKRLRWTSEENRLYLNFIQQQKQMLQRTRKGQKQFIFNKMEAYIKTRNSRNCKSHHQKMLSRFGTIDKIIEFQEKMGKIQNFNRSQREVFLNAMRIQQNFSQDSPVVNYQKSSSSLNQFPFIQYNYADIFIEGIQTNNPESQFDYLEGIFQI